LSDGRLPAGLEASSLIRRAEAEGGFGTIIARGDPDRGSLILLFAQRGVHVACLERGMSQSGEYQWRKTGPEAGATALELQNWSEKRRRFDPDTWLIELDIPRSERFIAETTAIG
jgi:hypothetical protein